MKKLLPLLLCVPFILFCQYKSESDLKITNNRKIKLIEVFEFYGPRHNDYISFVTKEWPDDYGVQYGWTDYYYDYNGNLIKDVGGYMVGEDKMGGYDIRTYEYDDDNQLSKEIFFSDLGEQIGSIIVYDYCPSYYENLLQGLIYDKEISYVCNIKRYNYLDDGPLHKTNDFISEVEYDEWDISYKDSDNQIQVSVKGQWIMSISYIRDMNSRSNKILMKKEVILDNEYSYEYVYDSKNRLVEVSCTGRHLAHCGDIPNLPENLNIDFLIQHLYNEMDPVMINRLDRLSHSFGYYASSSENFHYNYSINLRERTSDFIGEYFYDNNGLLVAKRYTESIKNSSGELLQLNHEYVIYRYNDNADVSLQVILEDPLDVFESRSINIDAIGRLFNHEGHLIENKHIKQVLLFEYEYY